MSEFLKSDPTITKIVNESTGFEQMRENMLQALAKRGVIARETGGTYGVRLLQPQTPEPAPEIASPANSAQDRYMQVIYPHGNDRYAIYAPDQETLAAKVAAIYALYGGQR